MNNTSLIKEQYLEAVKGIQADWFLNNDSKWYDYIIKLPKKLEVTYLIVTMNNQVFNGGFHQYFANGYGQFAKEAIAALVEIGAIKKSQLLNDALSLVNSANDTDEVFRKKLLTRPIDPLFLKEDLFITLGELDSKYYASEDEDIELLLSTYLQSIQ